MNNLIFKTTLLSFTLSQILLAQDYLPTSGDILRQVEPPKFEQNFQKELPSFEKEEKYKPAMNSNSNIKLHVKSFKFSSNTIFKEKDLLLVLKDYENKELSLDDLNEATALITRFYRDKGYFVAKAYIPAQELEKENAMVEIAIIEGTFGDFTLNQTGEIVEKDVLQNYLNVLEKGNIVSNDSLERQMLLINDLGGVVITSAEIYPGKETGSSDFSVSTKDTSKYYGYAIADNYGSIYTGRYRYNLGGFVNSISGKGDVLGATALVSNTEQLKNARVSYETPIGYQGLKSNFGISRTNYEIGKEFKDTQIHGKTLNLNAGLSYPIIKQKAHTLNIAFDYDHKNIKDMNNQEEDKKKNINSLSLSLNDYLKTSILNQPSTINSSISLTAGKVNFNNYSKEIDDLKIKGGFTKMEASLSQTQALVQNLSMTTSLKGQLALDKNLDGTEDFSSTGAYGVRAYTDSELSGDKGYLASLEFNYQLPRFFNTNHIVSTFIDHSKVWDNEEAIENIIRESRELNAVGVGYNLFYKDFSLTSSFAHGFGKDKTPTTNGTNTNENKAFVQSIYRF